MKDCTSLLNISVIKNIESNRPLWTQHFESFEIDGIKLWFSWKNLQIEDVMSHLSHKIMQDNVAYLSCSTQLFYEIITKKNQLAHVEGMYKHKNINIILFSTGCNQPANSQYITITSIQEAE